jgi:hypothetical protein
MTDNLQEILRQRLGLESDDATKDAEIAQMSPRAKLEHWTAWKLGDAAWAHFFLKTAAECGYEILERAVDEPYRHYTGTGYWGHDGKWHDS